MNEVLLHENARPRTSLHTREAIATVGWAVHRRPSYSPDLALSDIHLFDPLQDALHPFCGQGRAETPHVLRVPTLQRSFTGSACSV
jgi:hypothetical protein